MKKVIFIVFHVWQMSSFHWDLGIFLVWGGVDRPCIFAWAVRGSWGWGLQRPQEKIGHSFPPSIKAEKVSLGVPQSYWEGGRDLGWHVDNIDDM